MSSIEEVLARDGVLVYRTRGTSMEPMLRQNRDLVTIRVPSSRLKKYDVALYRRGKDCVAHRVIKVLPEGYLIRGDNTFKTESVPDGDVLGVLTGFMRRGKQYSADGRLYRLYARAWHFIFPIRYFWRRLRRFLSRRLGRAFGRRGDKE
ncbi:MAG: S24/S26 family peptidase [Clostridia bacterium]|jgi:hypothetical protein|nr:S24/S26 family peptidase [Clostridia bacterium]